MKRFKEKLFVIISLLLLPICSVLAFELSPAGGGWLEVSKPGGYAFVADHEDFGENLVSEFTLEMWIYLKRPLEFGEVWILFHKEGSYLLTLSGHIYGPDGIVPFREPRVAIDFYIRRNGGGGGSGASPLYDEDGIPLGQWHHVAFVHNRNGYQLYIGGKTIRHKNDRSPLAHKLSPLYIGGTGIEPRHFWSMESWTQFPGGLIDEVRISAEARYPVGVEGIKIVVPQGRFKPDEITLALWHFDGIRTE